MTKNLKTILLETMKERGIKIPKLAAITGIKKDRIYKWYQQGTHPKVEGKGRQCYCKGCC